ncbi:hypothetical protein [Natronobacterium gregoryi]|uniref:Uncharacterized protein n=2 Tax=Natronobacterium gregoryi TaxID=44930 RepID=L0AG44_NATGS|nr:hypothetical protein [Natronobacterium gregoryi]AFZ72045.1 hypothetical protein Natgr_0804 [Natronobacterium gregoryi SP2]ELY62679.1 hypothetical protein C490_17242 [Natronobacterium gregoryi SP2]PLK20894.1 hypothetical protein CYV19_07410 [Natronobacterium gregoryi SP2]SFJ20580.1 hypothetical protein SAMN05443661_11784 [Natronobacterium gregoryi]
MSDGSAAERIEYRRRNAVDPEEFLLDIGVVEPTDDEESLRFTSAFADRLEDQLDHVRDDGVDATDIATMFDTDESDVSEPDREYTAYKTGYMVRNWPSKSALQVDVATDRELRAETDRWDDVPVRQRYRMLQSLRSFLEACPFCAGHISASDRTVESCCGDMTVYAVTCDDCDRRYLEFSADAISNA